MPSIRTVLLQLLIDRPIQLFVGLMVSNLVELLHTVNCISCRRVRYISFAGVWCRFYQPDGDY